ncbi:MAG TPA: hypothetical protein VJC09_01480 [Candidatus Saccharimonadales bacterium]|nr:hypothetical protein [Candidatus Saccharimonadales bacterium]
MRELGDQYAELMASAWENGLNDVSDIVAMDAPPIVKWATCQQRVQDELEKVDWENAGLPIGPAQDTDETQIGERMPRDPRSIARRFLSFNFDDSLKIISLAAETASDNKIEPVNTFVGTLKLSKRNLLLPSRLPDPGKASLLITLEHQGNPDIAQMFGGPNFTGKPITYDAEADGGVFDWNSEIRQWAADVIEPGRGCPANGILTTTHPKIPLTYFFWDRLAEAMYQQP